MAVLVANPAAALGIAVRQHPIISAAPKQKGTRMIAVIFEVWPKPGRKQDYLDLAAELRPLLDQIDGFVSIERFESLYEPGKMLSLSFFRDEAAIAAWRNIDEHRTAHGRGRAEVFSSHASRIARV